MLIFLMIRFDYVFDCFYCFQIFFDAVLFDGIGFFFVDVIISVFSMLLLDQTFIERAEKHYQTHHQ